MARRRFFVPPEYIHGRAAVLPPDQSHHLRHVLRLKSGIEIELFDGVGNAYAGIVQLKDSGVHVISLEKIEDIGEIMPQIALALALIKEDRFELALQKATELGVDEIIPLMTRRCRLSIPANRRTQRRDRWIRIVRESCKQCRRSSIPEVRAPIGFEQALAEIPEDYPRFLLYEDAHAGWPVPVPQTNRILVCIGPEGGWDLSEVEMAKNAGWKTFRLGDTILRAETAAIVAVALFRYGIPSWASQIPPR